MLLNEMNTNKKNVMLDRHFHYILLNISSQLFILICK